jgi:hypothetical protein
MSPDVLLKKLLAAREFWHDLGGGKRVRLRRPAETDLAALVIKDADGKPAGIRVDLPQVQTAAVDWEGFTEADLIVSGASDVVPFAAVLWAALIADRRDWVASCASALLDAVLTHEKAANATAGN